MTPVGAPGGPRGVAGDEATDAEPVPAAFEAVTVNVYAVPLARPSTVHDRVEVVQVLPPELEVTRYSRIGRPAVVVGALHEITDAPLAPEVAVTLVGAPGAVAGVAGIDEADAAPLPAAFVAVTVNVYATPLVRPATVHDMIALVQVFRPGFDVTVYCMISLPPSESGIVHDTSDCPFWFEVADTEVGASGVVAGVAGSDASDASPVPTVLVAVTVNV